MSAPTASVVMITHDRRHLLERHLSVLLADPALHELVVVNDGSTDGTDVLLAELAATDARLVPIDIPNGGMDHARRTGVARATGDIVVLMDDDVEPTPTLVTDHLARHRDGDERVVVGYMPVEADDAEGFPTAAYAAEYEGVVRRYERDPANILADLWNGHVSMRRIAYLRARDGDPGWPRDAYFEDKNLGLRLRRLGLVGHFDRDLVAFHRHRGSHAGFRMAARRMGYGERLLHERHPELGSFGSRSYALRGLPRPLTMVVRLGDLPGAELLTAVLERVSCWAGRRGLHTVEDRTARLMRRIEQRIGARRRSQDRRAEHEAGARPVAPAHASLTTRAVAISGGDHSR